MDLPTPMETCRRSSRQWVATGLATASCSLGADLKPGTQSGSVIVTVVAPAVRVGDVVYQRLQSSQRFTIVRVVDDGAETAP